MATVYLLHLDRPLKHAKHYLGCTERPLEDRLREHGTSRGARLLLAAKRAGIGWRLVRTWDGGHVLEHRLKAGHNAPAWLCPICRRERHGR